VEEEKCGWEVRRPSFVGIIVNSSCQRLHAKTSLEAAESEGVFYFAPSPNGSSVVHANMHGRSLYS
jgi:hypothetical protein